MSVNPAYLIEGTLYEKCIKETDGNGDYISEFQRVFPQLFKGPFTITSEIEDLDKHRKALAQELNETDEDNKRYDIEDAVWYTYRYEVGAFYEANKSELDAIIDHYKQFLNEDGEKEDAILKIVRTPAGYWLATKHQSWLLARHPFKLSYTCKALGVYMYRWIKRVLKGWYSNRKKRGLRKAGFGECISISKYRRKKILTS